MEWTRTVEGILLAICQPSSLSINPLSKLGEGTCCDVPPNLLKAHGSHADNSLWLRHQKELHQPRASDLKRQGETASERQDRVSAVDDCRLYSPCLSVTQLR